MPPSPPGTSGGQREEGGGRREEEEEVEEEERNGAAECRGRQPQFFEDRHSLLEKGRNAVMLRGRTRGVKFQFRDGVCHV
jgi:hypothetical protein